MLNAEGRFAIPRVPAGDYTVHVTSAASRQEVHRESITVAADRTSWIQANVSVGGLRGRIESGLRPPRVAEVHQVHAGAITRFDWRVRAREQRGAA